MTRTEVLEAAKRRYNFPPMKFRLRVGGMVCTLGVYRPDDHNFSCPMRVLAAPTLDELAAKIEEA